MTVTSHSNDQEALVSGSAARGKGCLRAIRTIATRVKKSQEGPTIVFPWSLIIMLLLSSAAQYVGASCLSLVIYRTLEFSPVESNNFWAIMGFLGFLQPLLGWFSDTFTPFGERRRPCLSLGLLLNGVFLMVQALYCTQTTYGSFLALGLGQTISEMLVFVPLDAIIVELCKNPEVMKNVVSRKEEEDDNSRRVTRRYSLQRGEGTAASADDERKPVTLTPEEVSVASGAGQAKSILVRSVGSLVGGFLMTIALVTVNPIWPLLGSGITYCACLVLVPWLPKHCTSEVDRHKIIGKPFIKRMSELCDRVSQSGRGGHKSQFVGLVALIAFIFIYNLMPGASTIYYQYIAMNFEFSNAYLSATSLVGLVSSVLASYFYQWKLAKRNQTVIFVIGCAAVSFGYVTNIMLSTGFTYNTLHISNEVFVMIDTIFTSFLARIAFLPVLQLAASRCPVGYESTIFELFMASNLGATSTAQLVVSAITLKLGITTGHYENLWILLVICAASKWVPVFFLACLPKVINNKSDIQSEESPFDLSPEDGHEVVGDEADESAPLR